MNMSAVSCASTDTVLLYKKSDPQRLSNFRPIALLNSVYQLINIILADRLQSMVEKHLVFESSQFGFRWHRGVSNVIVLRRVSCAGMVR